MKGILNPDSPFNQFLVRIADLCIINILMLICCIPIVTIGASITAAHKTAQDMIHDNVTGVAGPFFKSFKTNFKQATIVWLLEAFFMAVMVGYFMLITVYVTGSFRTISFIVLAAAAFVLFSLTTYMYPMIARYENTLKQHLLNAMQLILFNLPRTILTVLVSLIPVAVAFFFTPFFLQIGVLFLLFGFAFMILIHNSMLKPIFDKIEAQKAKAEEAAKLAAEGDEETEDPASDE